MEQEETPASRPSADPPPRDLSRPSAARLVCAGAEEPVHGGDERHGERERGAEPALVRGLRLQRQHHAEPVEDLGGPREGEHGGRFGEPDRGVLAQDDPHGALRLKKGEKGPADLAEDDEGQEGEEAPADLAQGDEGQEGEETPADAADGEEVPADLAEDDEVQEGEQEPAELAEDDEEGEQKPAELVEDDEVEEGEEEWSAADTVQFIRKVIKQVEFYFSDINLATTAELMDFIAHDPDGFVPLSVVAALPEVRRRIGALYSFVDVLCSSSGLVVSDDGKKVRRLQPFNAEEVKPRIVVAQILRSNADLFLPRIFAAVGSVKSMYTWNPRHGGSKISRSDLLTHAQCVFVEYWTAEDAKKAVDEFDDARYMRVLSLLDFLGGRTVPEYAADKGGPDTTGHQHDFGSNAHISIQAQGRKLPQYAADEGGPDSTGHQHNFGSNDIAHVSAARLDHQVRSLDGNKVKFLQPFNTEEVQSSIVAENERDGALPKNFSAVRRKMTKPVRYEYYIEGKKVLIKTPSGFALFNVKEFALKEDKDIWIYFANSHEAQQVLLTLSFVKDDGADPDLCKLVEKFCKNGEELFVEDIKLKVLVEKNPKISCVHDGHTITELMWGIKNVLHEFLPEEKYNIPANYNLPLSKSLIDALHYYLINIPIKMVDRPFISTFGCLCFMDKNLKAVSENLRISYDKFLKISETIEDDLTFAKLLAISLAPSFVDVNSLSKTLSAKMLLKLEEAKQFLAQSESAPLDLPLHDINIIVESLDYLMHAPEIRDEIMTRVKFMESSRFQSEFFRMLRIASGCNAEQEPDITHFGDHVDFKDLKFKRTLLETPSGFAIFDVRETVFQDPEHMWTCFSDPYDARNVAFALGFVKLDDKSVAWKHVSEPHNKLRQLILRFCKNKVLFVQSTNLKTIIESNLDVECLTNDIAGDLIWGLEFVLPDFILEERGSLIDEYYLPLCKGLQADLKKYKINLSPRKIDRDFIYLFGHLVNLEVKLETLVKALNKNFRDSVHRLKLNEKLLRSERGDPSLVRLRQRMMDRVKLSEHLLWDPSSEKLKRRMMDLQRTCHFLPIQVKCEFNKSIACIIDICNQKSIALHELRHFGALG